MSNEGGSYQRIGKKGRVWVPDVPVDTAQAVHQPDHPARTRKPAAKRARKRTG